jgi:hypothetical protein
MAVEARVNPTWATKWIIMAVFLLGYGAMCIYDGSVAYPNHNKRVQKIREYKTETVEGATSAWNWKSDQAKRDWADYAKSQGWSDEDPGAPKSEQDLFTQWVQLAIVGPLGIAALAMVLVTSRRKLVADEQGVTGATGPRVPYSAIVSIDKARWDSKGIAILHWTDGPRSGKLKIDDWVYRDGDRVLEEVEKFTGLGNAAVDG